MKKVRKKWTKRCNRNSYTAYFFNVLSNPTLSNTDFCLAGTVGIEPTNGGVKVRCLTAWRRPSIVTDVLYNKISLMSRAMIKNYHIHSRVVFFSKI